ncbi:hypothetical protein M9H77_25963 [Catharanthus roseus]|uniref:Uncharacterized protein n=1 Tax=Catharanthus roseus TaxID=4058 RepID=A0ACC0AA73_CATRO|nr:hypothetical protein M9H77_25963 [Catharanthus roseus]
MEEVPAQVHPEPIVPDVLSRQHEHRSELIWSGDHETCYIDFQCRRFGRNLFQYYSTTPRSLVELIDGIGLGESLDMVTLGSCARQLWGVHDRLGGLSLTTDLGVVAYTCIAASADYGYLGRPSCSSWHYMVHIL